MTIEQAAAKLRAGQVSSVELTRAALAEIEVQQPKFNAYVTVTADLALEQAARADAELASGLDRGPLHGIPYALKDVFQTKGIRTTVGSKIFADHIPDSDSAVYELLRNAGAVLAGKAGMQEFAYGVTCDNPHFGSIRNPHDPSRIPGGSSGGSGVTVAAGAVFFAMGSDTGGSIRIPAAYCGCVGLKPTSGRVSRRGVLPLDFSLDHMGPLTRSAKDAGLVLNALAGADPLDDTSSLQPVEDYGAGSGRLAGVRVGVPLNFYTERLDPVVESAYRSALAAAESAGAVLVPMTVPDPLEVNTISRVILLAEASAALAPYLHRRDEFGADVMALLDQGRFISATDYINAQRLRRVYQREWSKIWTGIDCLFTPTAPILAPPIGVLQIEVAGAMEDVRLASTRFVRAINVLGLPAVSIPLPAKGLPIGLQIVGKPFGEGSILSIGSGMEKCLA